MKYYLNKVWNWMKIKNYSEFDIIVFSTNVKEAVWFLELWVEEVEIIKLEGVEGSGDNYKGYRIKGICPRNRLGKLKGRVYFNNAKTHK